jgi:serine O-acetyltransferase
MRTSLATDQLVNYLSAQLDSIFPDGGDTTDLNRVVPKALDRLEFCIERTCYAPYWDGQTCHFSHLNADQYTLFIYYCSHVAYSGNYSMKLASKLFYLNKVLHSFHCMYDTVLPDIFLVVHGSGIVLGKATYSNYVVFMHGCTIGANSTYELPRIGEYLLMYPNSTITGNCTIGSNVCISNGSHINDEILPANSLVFGSSPNLIVKSNRLDRLSHVFPIIS